MRSIAFDFANAEDFIGIPQNQKSDGRPGTAAQPAATVVEISDPAAARARIELRDLDAMQLRSSSLRERRVIVRLESAAVVFHSTNLPVPTGTSVRKALLAYVAFGPQAKGTFNGLPVRPDLMLVAESESEAQFVTNDGYESISFLLPPQDISAHLAARQPELFNERKNERIAAHVELLETLMMTLRGASDFEPDRGDRTQRAHRLTVKVAEDFALSHVHDHLYVSDLCRAAAVNQPARRRCRARKLNTRA